MPFSPQIFWTPTSLPERRFTPMPAQPVVQWTPVRMMEAAWLWLIAETSAQERVKSLKG